jgi:hypothetical protein
LLFVLDERKCIKDHVVRPLPDLSSAESTFAVTFYFNVNESDTSIPSAVGLTEYFPAGWTVSSISSGGVNQGDRIEWISSSLTSPVQDTNISYVLSVPSDANGHYPFSGQFNYSSTLGAVSESTIGDSSVFATDKCALIGDASPCGVVGIPEVIDVITQWSSDEATLADVIFSLLFIFPIHKINILRSLRLIFKTSGVNPI